MSVISHTASTPVSYFIELLNELGGKIDFIEFSKYVSGGQGITLQREIFKVAKDNFLKSIEENITQLKPNEELAVHSNVYFGNECLCVPLIDFAFNSLNDNTENICKQVQRYFGEPLYLYNSGRSFHGYILTLISRNEWYKFLGFLLLLNSPNDAFHNIDSRWIGHSLEFGFSALRLSCNSKYYIQKPEFVKMIQ